MNTLSIDIETYSSADLSKTGVYKYVEADDFEILIFAYSFNGSPVETVELANGEYLPPEVVEALLDKNVLKKAFNAQFERVCISEYLKRYYELEEMAYAFDDTGYLSPDQWRCTSVDAMKAGLPATLKKSAAALKLDEQKDAAGTALINFFSKPCKATKANGMRTRNLPHHDIEKWNAFVEYCRQDVVTEMAVSDACTKWLNIGSRSDRFEQMLYTLDQRVNDKGVLLDMELVNGALQLDELYKEKLTKEAQQLTGLENPNSPKQLLAWLADNGLTLPNLTKDTVKNALQGATGQVKRMLEIRQESSKTSTAKFVAMEKAVCKDGRVRGLLQFYGASRTGRWAGRLVQVQNLPQNKIPDLELARDLVKARDLEALEMFYDAVPDTLSQLIRTAFVAPNGKTFAVSDFSAIEARVIAWLAGEKWRLEVFSTHGKIYEASAAQMFNVPIETIGKKSPLRQKGKVAELALGYQGGTNALISMGALGMGIQEDELKPLVDAWRKANPQIKKLWFEIERAAFQAIERPGDVIPFNKGMAFYMQSGSLMMQLPSGRCLTYHKAHLRPHRTFEGKQEIAFWGVDGTTKAWCEQTTYGGKLTENCLSADTQVLTHNGWKLITDVKLTDKLWDGIKWVSHEGLAAKGEKPTIDVNGLRVTADHKLLTDKGWLRASSSEGHYWREVVLPYGYEVPRFGREKVDMGSAVRVWRNDSDASERIYEEETKVVWVHEGQTNCREKTNTWNVEASSLRSMALNGGSLQPTNTSSVGELWWSWYLRMRFVEEQFRAVLGRHGRILRKRFDTRTRGREQGLQQRKLCMGDTSRAKQQSQNIEVHRHTMGAHDDSASRRQSWHWTDNAALPRQKRMPTRPIVHKAGRTEQVYDLINVGDLHRFTVMSDVGPVIVHNCVQAIARDCLAVSLLRLEREGYDALVMHVHDEAVLEADENSIAHIEQIMGQEISWAKGLPLEADGFETVFYKKD